MGYETRLSRWECGSTQAITPSGQDAAFLKVLFDTGATSTDMVNARVRTGKAQGYTTRRLMELERKPNGYVFKPEGQRGNYNANYRHIFYDITPKGVALLLERGFVTENEALLRRKLKGRGQPSEFFHDALTAHITNSIALGAGERFISTYEALAKTPDAQRYSKRPITFAEYGVTPDAVFGIRYAGGSASFFAVEADLATEPIHRREKGSSFARKIAAYSKLFKDKAYRKVFGFPNLRVLTVTVSERRMRSMLDLIDAFPGGFLFAHTAHPHGKLPATAYLFDQPWETAAGPDHMSNI